jgi:hypothetical protein
VHERARERLVADLNQRLGPIATEVSGRAAEEERVSVVSGLDIDGLREKAAASVLEQVQASIQLDPIKDEVTRLASERGAEAATARLEPDAIGERVATQAAEQILPRVVEKLDPQAIETQLIERAIAQGIASLKKQHDLDRIIEKLAAEANAKAFAQAREGLDKMLEKLTERVVRDGAADALPRVREKLDVAAAVAAVTKQAATLAAQEVVASAELGPLKGELASLPERVAKDALARALEKLDARIAEVGTAKSEPASREAPASASKSSVMTAPRGVTAAEVDAIVRSTITASIPDVGALEKKIVEAATEKALAALGPRLPNVDALKADLYRSLKSDLPAASTPAEGTPTLGGINEGHFRALAREVKTLKGSFGQLMDHKVEPRDVIESVEFKKVLDARMRELIEYVKNDIVPTALKNAGK